MKLQNSHFCSKKKTLPIMRINIIKLNKIQNTFFYRALRQMQLTKYQPKTLQWGSFIFYFELIRQVDDIVLCFLVLSWNPLVSRTRVEKTILFLSLNYIVRALTIIQYQEYFIDLFHRWLNLRLHDHHCQTLLDIHTSTTLFGALLCQSLKN